MSAAQQRPRLPLGALNTATRIGLVYMASSTLMEAEMYAMATPAATIHTSRVTLPSVTVEGIDAMMRSPELRTAVELVAQAPLDVLVFGGTSASFLHGTEWDRMLVNHFEEWSGLAGKCTTTSTASIAALKAVGAGPISLVTPYRQEVIDRATRFFGDNGHPVVASVGLGITSDWELAQVPLEQIYDLALETDTSESSAVFISCTNFASVGAIAALESALGKPVISAVQASFWYALEIAGVHAARPGFGMLMDSRLDPAATGDPGMTAAAEAHHPIAGTEDVAKQFDSTVGVDPVPGTHTLIDRVLEVLAATALAGITLILFANAVLRFAFNSPLGWTEELVTGLMLWLTMLGFTLGVRRRESIAIRAFVGRLSVRTQVWLRLATDLLTAAVLLHLAWFAYLYVTTFGDDPLPYLRLPSGFFTAALPVGAVAAALIVLFQLPGCRAAILRQLEEEKS